jgi:hypothetical protein
MAWVWENGPDSPTDCMVMLALADFANDDGECWPSIAGICRKARMSERGVQTVLRRLQDGGYLEIEAGGGRKRCNVYRLKTPQQVHPADNAPPQMTAKTPQMTAENPAPGAPEPSRTIIEPSVGGGGSARARETDPSDQTDRERLLLAMGHDPSGVTAAGRIVGNPADMAEAARWRALGLSQEQQVAVIAEVMARKRDGPPISFSYFTAAMQRRAGELAKPPLQPTETRHTGAQAHGRASRGSEFLDAFIAGARSAS